MRDLWAAFNVEIGPGNFEHFVALGAEGDVRVCSKALWGGLERNEILRRLDRAIFEEKEALLLRLKANEFWGFGQCPDERLYGMGEMASIERP